MGKNDNKNFIMGSIVGGLIGAATALFLAPKSGKEIRENLGQQANAMKDRTGKFTSETLERSSGIANAAKEKTVSLSQVVTEQSAQIMNKVRDITSASKDQSGLIEKEVEDALEQISDGGSSDKSAAPVSENAAVTDAISEAVEAIENDEQKEQINAEFNTSTEEPVKSNS